MHIGILCEHSDPARGGAERYLDALVRRLRVHGHRATMLARTGPCAAPVRAFPAWRRPRVFARTLLPRLRDLGAERVLAALPVPGCDFFQPHHGIYAAAIPAHLDPLPWGVRHLRRANPVRALHFARLRACEAEVVRTARVLALSPRILADLERFHPGARAELVRPGVDLRRFFPGERPAGGPSLLFVAGNFRLKGLATALAALQRLPHARLTVVGPGRPRPAPRVEYVAGAPDLPELFRRASALVHPTYYDTASLVVLEALASGIAPVTTVRDGNADLAVEGGGAALDDPADADRLAAVLERVLAHPPDGRARAVAERFDEDAMLDRAVEVLTAP